MNTKPIDILLISDVLHPSLITRSLAKMFNESTVRVEETQAHAYSYLEKNVPDVIICDWALEGFDATEFCETIIRNIHFAPALVVAVVYNAQECREALSTKVHHVVDITDAPHAEHLLELNFSLIKRLEDIRQENRILRSAIRTKEAAERQIINALQKTIQVRFPESADSAPFVIHAVEWILEQFRNEEEAEVEKTQVLYAAQLAWLGKMHLPDSEKHARVTLDGASTSNMTAFVPLQAESILDRVDALSGARTILKNMYENYDGTGFPDRKQHWQIPLGSRVLRAVCDLEEISRSANVPLVDALEQLKRHNRRVYDHRVVALLEEYVLNVSKRSRDHSSLRAVQLFDLMEGMTLANDIVTNSGLKLMNAGTVLRENLIKRIQNHNAMDPILGNIYVQLS